MFVLCTLLIYFLSTSIFCKYVVNDDEPLILTPLIENGEYEKARTLSKVDSSLFAGLESHSAFITVNKTFGSHLFFWFFPVENKPLESTPWIIWLQGGPGVSSLFGLFVEIGPLQYVNATVQRRPITWASDYSVLFIDNPVGTGFSFTEEGRYVTNEDEGIAIGDGFIDPPSMLQYSKFGLQVGLLDPVNAASLKVIEDIAKQAYKDGDMKTYRREWSHAYILFEKMSSLQSPYNYAFDEEPSEEYVLLLNMREVKKALHVGRIGFTELSWEVYCALSDDFPITVKPWLEELLENNYSVMCYGGQLDVIVAYAQSVNSYHTLQWSGAEGYINAPRWLYMGTEKRPEMYIKKYANFMDVMIKGAGHMTSYDQPQPCKDLIEYFIYEFQNNQENH